MSSYTIEQDIEIDAPLDIVWQTVTEPSQISRWFSEQVDFDPAPGALGTLTFPEHDDGTRMVVDITVISIEAPHLFSFRWIYPSGEVATVNNSVLVTFSLNSLAPNRTLLRVTETGLELLEMSDDEKTSYVQSHSDGWRECAERLTALFTSPT